MNEQSWYGMIDVSDDPPPAAAPAQELAPETRERIARGIEALLVWAREVAPLHAPVAAPAPVTALGATMSPGMVRLYGYLAQHNLPIEPYTPVEAQRPHRDAMRSLLVRAAGDEAIAEEHRLEMVTDLRNLLRRMDSVVDGRAYVAPTPSAPQDGPLTIAQVAAEHAPGPTVAEIVAQSGAPTAAATKEKKPRRTRYIGLAMGDDTVGRLVDWSRRGEVQYGSLRRAAEANDIDPTLLPSASRPDAVLTRAVKALRGTDVLVRQNLKLGGYDVWYERPGDEGSAFNQLKPQVRVWLDDGLIESEAGPDVDAADAEALAERVRTEYHRQLDAEVLDSTIFGRWLVRYVTANLGGFAMRPEGGFYYVPPGGIAGLQALSRCVGACSATAIRDDVYMMTSAGLATRALDTLGVELAKKTEEIEAKLSGEPSIRWARARIDDLDELDAKFDRNEKLLDIDFSKPRAAIAGMRKRLGDVQTRGSQIEID
jgi:hypothetical protein